MCCVQVEPLKGDRAQYYTSLSRERFIFFVRMVEACGAEEVYKKLTGYQETLLSFRDALTVGITRLKRIRGWRNFAHFNSDWGSPDTLRRNAIAALMAVSSVSRETVFRPIDPEVREARRVQSLTGEFGPGGQYGPVRCPYPPLNVLFEIFDALCPCTFSRHHCVSMIIILSHGDAALQSTPSYRLDLIMCSCTHRSISLWTDSACEFSTRGRLVHTGRCTISTCTTPSRR